MSASRKSRGLKTFNPEEQPQIHQFIVNSGQSQTAPTITPSQYCETVQPRQAPYQNQSKGKKRRRSTGEKNCKSKKAKPCCRSKQSILTRWQTQRQTQTVPPSLCYVKSRKWKKDWVKKITTSKDQEITEMEERLNNNIRTTIDTSIKDALRVIQTSLNSSVENNPIINSHSVSTQRPSRWKTPGSTERSSN